MRKSISSSIAIAFVLAGAVSQDTHAQQAQAAPAASDVVQGMSRERLGRIAGVMKQEIEKGHFPGAVTLIARRGEIVHFEAHGFLDQAKTKPLAKDSIFRMASMTKPITTVAAMMLVEQGVFTLNVPSSSFCRS